MLSDRDVAATHMIPRSSCNRSISGHGMSSTDFWFWLRRLRWSMDASRSLIRLRPKGCDVFVARGTKSNTTRRLKSSAPDVARTSSGAEACARLLSSSYPISQVHICELRPVTIRPLSRRSRYRLTVRSKSSLKDRRNS